MNISDDPVSHLDRTFGPWRTSSFSHANGNQCVEVAVGTDAVALRDSKNPDGAVLVFHHAEWSTFVDGRHRRRVQAYPALTRRPRQRHSSPGARPRA